MNRVPAVTALVGTVLLVASGCEQAITAHSTGKPRQITTASQRFFSGRALPGEFLSLRGLPPIPATFDGAEP